MNLQTAEIENFCLRRSVIAAYIDGDLPSQEELNLEIHLAVCSDCSRELNEQKKLLLALDFALESEKEIQLPDNFTKLIVANAESKVSGLRRPQERSKALFICLALLLVGILGLGAEIGTVLKPFTKFAEQALTICSFVWGLTYEVSVGTAVILRSLGNQIVHNSGGFGVFVFGFGFASLLILSRVVPRSNRS